MTGIDEQQRARNALAEGQRVNSTLPAFSQSFALCLRALDARRRGCKFEARRGLSNIHGQCLERWHVRLLLVAADAHPKDDGYEYDVALSFAGQQRHYVAAVASWLVEHGVKVFYDEFETTKLWGRDGIELLSDVYLRRAYRVVMFISKDYVEAGWPRVEQRSALARFLEAPNETHVLPVRFDDVEVPGLPPQVIYQRADNKGPIELARLILQHLVDAARCDPALLDRVGAAEGRARLVQFRAMAARADNDEWAIDYRIHNGSGAAIDGVVLAVVDPWQDADPDNQSGCVLELVIGPVGAGETIDDKTRVGFSGDPPFSLLPYLGTLLWTDVDGNHWATSGSDLRWRNARARTC